MLPNKTGLVKIVTACQAYLVNIYHILHIIHCVIPSLVATYQVQGTCNWFLFNMKASGNKKFGYLLCLNYGLGFKF